MFATHGADQALVDSFGSQEASVFCSFKDTFVKKSIHHICVPISGLSLHLCYMSMEIKVANRVTLKMGK